jgi:predicted RNA-binding protein
LAKIYTSDDDKKPVVENVTEIVLEDGQVQVETLFGEKNIFRGRVTQINFTDSKVSLKLS